MKIKNFDIKKKIFIIAEIGNNHEGNLKVAKKLINLAAKAGVDAVKFQTFKTEEFVHKSNKKRFKQLKNFELSFDEFKILKNVAHKKKLKFISTPLDLKSAKFLIKNADAIKIASGDNNFFPMIHEVIKGKKPIIISTGMTNFEDIQNLLKIISKNFKKKRMIKNIALLHCVTSYPVEFKYANINSIPYLINKLDLPIGYSDHTLGLEACLGAVALGARIIEKHFTIDKKFSKFRDHALSSDYLELKALVTSVRKMEKLKGNFEKIIQPPEKKLIKLVRRGLYSRITIKTNDRISLSNSIFLRPTKSNDFLELKEYIGKKTKKNIKKNQRINKLNLY